VATWAPRDWYPGWLILSWFYLVVNYMVNHFMQRKDSGPLLITWIKDAYCG